MFVGFHRDLGYSRQVVFDLFLLFYLCCWSLWKLLAWQHAAEI